MAFLFLKKIDARGFGAEGGDFPRHLQTRYAGSLAAFDERVMPSLPVLSSMSRLRPHVAGEHDNPPEVQPRRFDHPFDALAARLDAFELELLVKLQGIESPQPSPPPRLSVGEIVRLVAGTALACIAVMLAGVWIWLR